MKTLGLYKKQKLCSARAIEDLFGPGGAEFTRLCYPLRAVARPTAGRQSDAPIAFMISVPKKRLRHAVDRVLMRRRIREAFRLNHQSCRLPEGLRVDIAFVYVANEPVDYRVVETGMRRILDSLSAKYNPSPADEDNTQ